MPVYDVALLKPVAEGLVTLVGSGSEASEVSDSEESEDINMVKGISVSNLILVYSRRPRLRTNLLYSIPDCQIHFLRLLHRQKKQ
jgi:hypothetical protein